MNRFRYGNLPFMVWPLVARVFDQANEGNGGGGTPQNTPTMDPRVDALASRLDTVVGALSTLAERDEMRNRQVSEQQERQGVERLVSDAQSKVEAARNKLALAHEEGDSRAIAEATAEISSASAEHVAAKMQLQAFQARQQQQQNQPRPQQQQQPQTPQQQQKLDDTNLRAWREKNKDWYGIDPDLTKAALEVDREIQAEKVLTVGSTQYFNAVDARLRAKFPDKFKSSQSSATLPSQRGSNMNGNRTPAGQGRIPASVAEGYARMGIDVTKPEVAEQMIKARETAVAKGFLPEQPHEGRIVTR